MAVGNNNRTVSGGEMANSNETKVVETLAIIKPAINPKIMPNGFSKVISEILAKVPPPISNTINELINSASAGNNMAVIAMKDKVAENKMRPSILGFPMPKVLNRSLEKSYKFFDSFAMIEIT